MTIQEKLKPRFNLNAEPLPYAELTGERKVQTDQQEEI